MRPREESQEDLNAAHAKTLLPLLSLNAESVFVEAGEHCRGRLPMNLALHQRAKKYITLNPSLQRTVDASQLSAPLVQAPGLLQGAVSFLCAPPENWHYRGVTHVLLHNARGTTDACRGVVARLAASPTFRMLLTMTPLPFQTSLVYIGELSLKLEEAEGEVALVKESSSSGIDEPISFSSSTSSLKRMLTPPKRLPPSATSPRVYIYSTSWSNVPVGTLATLYCSNGVCHLPPAAARGLSLPPLAAHTSSYQDHMTTMVA